MIHRFVEDTPVVMLNWDGEIVDTVKVEQILADNANTARQEKKEAERERHEAKRAGKRRRRR